MNDTSSNFYKKIKIPIYGAEIFRDVGKAFCISLLDLNCLNPVSRLLKTPKDNLPAALEKLRKDVKREYFKPSIKSIKKKGKKKVKKEGPSFELVLGAQDHVQAAKFQVSQEPDTDEDKEEVKDEEYDDETTAAT